MTTKDESPRLEGVQYTTGEEQRPTKSPKKNEVAGPKWKWCSVVDVSGDENKIGCCKEQYCIGTWNIRSTNQGKFDTVPGGSDSKVSAYNAGRPEFDPWDGKILGRRKWQPSSVLLPGKSHGRRSLVGYSLWVHKELDTTERLHFTSPKHEMVRININILGISELKWMGMGKFNSNDHYIYYCW